MGNGARVTGVWLFWEETGTADFQCFQHHSPFLAAGVGQNRM
ncbi:hypothetical protein Amal_02990 [Acetobacter malorum]|uniref:Uncharacterized protein n=1 Tax=Acetobacter malorum TaxID=178901 RepID=A0A177G8C8_9PROT|nr:hypothetical protein Amal_02990 [Acetobacter malorum]